MEIKKGIPVSGGVVIGPALVLDSERFRIHQKYVQRGDVAAELERYDRAVERVCQEILDVKKQVADNLPTDIGRIIETHLSILRDPHLQREIRESIETNLYTAERSVSRTLRRYIKAFKGMKDDYFSQRFEDIYDIEKRLLRVLLGDSREDIGSLREKVVIVARDLTPSETVALDREKVIGLVMETGGLTSHTAIMARSMKIPSVVGLGSIVDDVSGGDTVLIDGNEGIVIIGPDDRTIRRFEAKLQSLAAERSELEKLSRLPAVTQDGVSIRIFGNIEFPRDVDDALACDAEGIGLFRTEFLFMGQGTAPTEQAHIDAYQRAIRALGGKPITIRTLDFGADKEVGSLAPPLNEANPFLGCRSIRYSFERLDLFVPQLRAILRASAYGPVRILFPMISSLEEVQRAKFLLDGAKRDLAREGIPFDERIPTGAMIEIPSAVVIADLLAREVDFFSIGTNDLIQYTLAVDRVNERVAKLYQPTHPAVIRLLKTVADAGRKRGIGVSMCGEMPTDGVLAVLLIGLEYEEFSVTPSAILNLKRVVRSIRLEDAKKIARRALSLPTSDAVLQYARRRVSELYPAVFPV